MDFDLFTQKHADFFNRCSDLNASENWDENEYCEMELFYNSSLTNLILSLIVSDELIDEKEVEFVNRFGIGTYDADRLRGIYGSLRDNIDKYYEEDIFRDIELLKKVDTDMAEDYKALVKDACELVISCDDVITEKEKNRAQMLIGKL